jgi:hypothetical protein
MLTYQVRPRVLRVIGDKPPQFPAEAEVVFCFQPLQPFGMEVGGGRTATRAEPARMLFNANTGQHSVESTIPLAPLDVRIEEPIRTVTLKGNELRIVQRFDDLAALQEFIDSIYFGAPLLMAVDFADPPRVERVHGRIGDVQFRWELALWRAEIDVTSQERQEQRVLDAWGRFAAVTGENGRRLLAALHYFHVACRLRQESKFPGEFMAESLLNLHKVLEVLYGPGRDDVRAALAELGFEDDEIERDYVPVMILRDSIDIGHPSLELLKQEQLTTLHRFAERGERAFRTLLSRLLDAVAAGRATLPIYEFVPADARTVRTIEEIRVRLDALGDRA